MNEEQEKKIYENWREKGNSYPQGIKDNLSSDTFEDKKFQGGLYPPIIEVTKILIDDNGRDIRFLTSDNKVISLTTHLKSSVFTYEGSVDSYDDLPTEDLQVGDTWNVKEAHKTDPIFNAGANLVWNGTKWDSLEGIIDLSNYYIKAEVDKLVKDESDRAKAKESELNLKITTLNSDNTVVGSVDYKIKIESDRAKAKETELNTKITTEATTARAAELKLTNDLSALSTLVNDNETDIESKLSSEVTRSTNKDNSIESRLTVIEGNSGVVGSIDNKIKVETDRAIAKETELNGKITIINSDSSTTGSIDNKVKIESDRAKGAESTLGTDLTTEITRAKAKETELETLSGTKVDKVTGKGLSTNDFTNTLKTKLDNHPTDVYSKTEVNDKIDAIGAHTDSYTKIESDAKYSTLTYLGTELDKKVDKVNGKGLSDNNFTDAVRVKLEGIEAGANVNVVTMVAGRIGNVVLTKADVGLANAENTTDLNKPISSATQTALNTKVDKVTGKVLSTNDYTTVEKTKLGTVYTQRLLTKAEYAALSVKDPNTLYLIY